MGAHFVTNGLLFIFFKKKTCMCERVTNVMDANALYIEPCTTLSYQNQNEMNGYNEREVHFRPLF